MTPETFALSFVVALAFVVEAALGFGATVVTVSLGALLVPIDVLLPAFVPLNMVLSAWLAARHLRSVDVSLLVRRVLPAMALGMPLGMFAFQAVDTRVLSAGFGVFVVVLAGLELAGIVRARLGAEGSAAPTRVLPKPFGAGLLALAGIVHGAFATGGPLVVYVLGRELDDKARFRATLAVLWLVLNVVLVGGFVAAGRLDGATLLRSVSLGAALLVGLVLGEVVHRRVPPAAFKTLVWSLLLVAGGMLVLRG